MLAGQRVQLEALTGEYVPAGQATHALKPAAAYCPLRQAVQLLDPAGAANPVPQGSHVWAPLVFAGNEYVPAPQTSHVVFRPRLVEAVPSAQSSQSTSDVLEQALQPGYRLYLPAPQTIQGPPGGPQRPIRKRESAYPLQAFERNHAHLPGTNSSVCPRPAGVKRSLQNKFPVGLHSIFEGSDRPHMVYCLPLYTPARTYMLYMKLTGQGLSRWPRRTQLNLDQCNSC